jgi:hypothetical protein
LRASPRSMGPPRLTVLHEPTQVCPTVCPTEAREGMTRSAEMLSVPITGPDHYGWGPGEVKLWDARAEVWRTCGGQCGGPTREGSYERCKRPLTLVENSLNPVKEIVSVAAALAVPPLISQPAALDSAVGAGTIGGNTLTGTVPRDLNSVHTDSAPVHSDLVAVHTDSCIPTLRRSA